MNFPGKFDSAISGAQPTTFVDVKHHNPDDKSGSITIADAQLLFNGDYKRSGLDLILSKDGHQQLVANYFKGEHRASLASPDGSHLAGGIVSALAGNVEYAQATNPVDAGKVIGHVTKIVGSATAIRNGVSIILNNGDNVEKGDVVQAGSGSQLSVTFIDGTVFGLSSNARMVLNEMVYDPNGSSNSSLLTLVAGTISFVAGETAKHGDMKIDTPTAVLGIRGTAVLVEIDFTVPSSGTTPAVTFQVLAEPDGHTGSYILYSKPTATNPTSVEIGRVDQAGLSYAVTANNQVASTTAPPLPPQVAAVVIETFVEKFNAPPPQVPAPAPDKTAPNNANPNSTTPGGGGSSTPPPPATPLDTSPIDNHNTQPTDQNPTPTPISTTPTPSGTGTTTPTTPPTTIAAAGGAVIITVTPAADTPSFTIPQHVTTPSAPPATFVAFVPGSGTVPSVSTNGTPPPGVDLTKLITVNESNGTVSYNPADFAFLKQGQSAVATIAFQSNDGTENVPETLTLTIDGQAPVPPVVTVSNPSIIITNSATQTISGTVAAGLASAGATVTLLDTVNGVTHQIGTATVASDGTWATQVTLQGDGTHSIVAQDTDAVGNVGSSAPVVVTLDTIPPTVSITTAGNISNVATHTISGTVIAGDAAIGNTVELLDTALDPATQLNVTKLIGTATVGPGGTWTTSLTLSGDGDHTIVATDIDAAGGVGASSPVVFTLSTTLPPTVTIATAPETSNSAAQTISGHVSQGQSPIGTTVALYDTFNGVASRIGTATVDGTGGWTTQVTLSGDGAHNIVAQDIDIAGNLGASDPVVFTLDTLPPTVVINTAGVTTNHSLQAISGSVTAGEAALGSTVTLLDNGDVFGTATVGSGGLWTTNVTLSGDGIHNIVAQDTDAAGNVGNSTPIAFTLDTVAPMVKISTTGTTTNQAQQTISGSVATTEATAGSTVTLFDNGNAIGTASVGSGGAWTTAVTLSGDGVHNITAQDIDAVGNVGTSTPVVFTLDTVSPTVTIGTPGTTTNQATQTISGTVTTTEAAAGNTVTLLDTVNGVTTQIGTATVSGGSWTTSVTLSGNGANSIVAQDTDAAGNTGSSSATVFTLATVAPTIAITGPVAGDNIINKAEAAAGVTIGGTAAAGIGGAAVNGQTATITIVDSTNSVKDTLTTTVSGGAWSVSLTPTQAQGLADGSYTIKANVSDAAGNTATTATQAITVDETSPAIAITSPVAGDNIINKTEAAAGVTISGTVAAGPDSTVNGPATITIVDSTNTVKDTLTTTVSGGAWTVNLSAAQAQGLADGSYTIKANVSDAAGNAATTATQTITVDETAPTIAITSPVAGDNIINKTEAAAGVTLSGTVAAGPDSTVNGQTATITIVDSTNAVKDTLTTTVSGGAWSVSLTPAQAQGLADGSYTIKANVSDAAGNAATTATQAITVDETSPAIAITSPVAGDNIINKTEAAAGVTISGTAASTVNGQIATITIVDGTNTVKDTLTTTVSGGAWSVNLSAAQAQGLTDGTYTIKANVTDTAGNAATTATQAISVDTLAPTVTIGTPGTTTNQATQTISGAVTTIEAAAGNTVTLLDTVNGVTTQIGTATVSGGTWTTSVTLSGNGANSIVAQDTDAAGNTGSSSATVFTLATVAPTIAITGPVAGDNIINKAEAAAGVTIGGTAAAGIGGAAVNGQIATITIVDATNTVKDTLTTTVSGGAWTVNLSAAQAQGLADGSYTIKANVSDAAGNAATTATQAITVDETAPSIAITSPVAGDNIINKAEAAAGVSISGTVAAGPDSTVNGQIATITIVDSTNTVKDTLTTTVSGGAWTVNLSAAQAQGLADGSYTVKANVSDAAGNAATTATQAITVDETAPTIAITSPVAGDNIINKTEAAAGVTIGGTAAAGIGGAAVNGQIATITIVDSTNTVKDTLTTTVSGGAWSVNLSAAQAQGLADGSYTVKANVSDAAGNAATTATQAITVDETAPTIAITSPVAGDNIINKTEAAAGVTISGTVAAGPDSTVNGPATITIVDATNAVKDTLTTTVSGGAWSVNLSAAQAQGLTDGTYTIKANVSDAAGNAATTATQAITVDETSPTIAITSPVAGDNIVNKTEAAAGVTISGTAAAGAGGALVNGSIATITIVDSTNTVKDTLTATVSGGVWTVNLSAAQVQGLTDGSYTIKANVSDAAGNAATTATQAITVDETSPTIAITSPVAGDNIVNKTEAAAGVTISGTAAAGAGGALVNGSIATITIVDSTNTVKDTLTTTVSGGAWSVTLSAAQAQGLADGSYTIKANVTDAAGNPATTATQAINVDTAPPTVTIGTPGTTTNQATQTISGTVTTTEAAAGNTVTLLDTVNGVTTQIGTATVSGGTWTTSVTLSGNGANSIVAQDTDAAGNTGSSSATVFTLATVAPTIAITGPVAGDNIINKAEAAAGVTIGGTAAAGIGGAAVNGQTATITILDATNTVKDTLTTTVSGGAWTVNLSAAQAQGLADGSYTIKANVSDAAGNAATTATQAITVDETAPTIAITSSVAGDNIINKTEAAAGVTLSGTAASTANGQTATITIVDATNTVKDTLTTTVSGGAWTVNLTPTRAQGLTDGTYTIKANVSDAAGNAATTATQAITIDETSPAIAITSPVAGDNTINKTEAAAGVSISGTAASTANGQTATITIVDGTNTIKDTLTTTVSGGAWSVNLSAAQAQGLTDGTYTIKANVSDAAGNAATTATQAITVDETSPTIAITSPVAGDNIVNKAEAAAGVSISGTVASTVNGQSATITIVDSTNTVKDTLTTTVSGGAWTVNLSAAQAQGLTDGTYTIKANVSDAAGNAATTATQAITVDETSPTIAITSPVAGDNIVNKAEAAAGVSISGTVASTVNGQSATITIVDSTNTVKDTLTTTVSGGAWSVTLSAAQAQGLADGSYTIKANVTDAAGNPATTATQAITVDTAPPTVTISSPGGPTSQSTETISGTVTTTEASAGGTVMLFDTFNGVTTQIGTATMSGSAWSTTVTLSGSGTHSVVAEDTDAAGNTGSSTPVVYSLSVVANSWANPSGGNWTVGANWSSGAVPSNTANVTIQPILATAPYSISISSGTTVLANSLMLDDPLATLIAQGTLSIVGSLTLLAGTIDLENGGTLSLGTAATPFQLNFAGTGGNLVLGNSATYAGTITALSTATGTVSISGSGNLNALTGDALDLTASGGTQSNPSNLVVGLTGIVTGAATGIDVVQNAVGNIAVTTSGSVIGQTQRGILAEESATGVGSVIVAGSANVAGDGSAFSGIVAENLNTANANTVTVSQTGNVTGGYDGIKALTDGAGSVAVTTGPGATITGMNDYGIEAYSNSTGNVSVTTTSNDTIVSGSVGINVYNQATSIPQTGGVTTSTITVTATGTIDSGFLLTGSSSRPAGILAGYKGGTTAGANSAVYGNVIVNNSTNINSAGGDGIRAYNYGNGNVTISDLAGTTIIAQGEFGIQGTSYGSGNITVSSATGDIIDSGSSGLAGVNLATSIAAAVGSTVSVTARGTINSGVHLTPSGSQPQGVSSGYFPGNAGNSNTSVNGTVTLDSFANVTAAAGWALDAYNYGNGSVTLTDEANTTVSGAQYGIGAYSNSSGSASSGSVTINVLNNATISSGSRYGLAGIQASESNGGIISVTTSTGDLVNSGGAGIAVNNSASTATSASQINITSVGTINAGYGTNPGGGQADGIVAGYNPSNLGTVNSSVAGNVFVNNSATIEGPIVTNGIPAPATTGIQLYNYGSGSNGGNISLTLQSSSKIISQIDGVNADAQGGGNVTIINNGSITDTSGVGISANIGMNVANSVTGLVQVTNTGTITALGSSYAPAVQINNSSIQTATVTNSGTISANLLGKDSSNQAIAVYNGTSTINNTGTISGNVSLNGGTFNNNAGGIWNLGGSDYFGNGTSAIVNAGIINILGLTFLNAGATFTFTNTNTVNVAANGDAWINAPVSGGGGTFTIGDRAELEFTSSVATGQTVSFTDGNGLLVLDSPSSFSGSIAGLAIGDAIELQGVGISSATISGSTLSVQTANSGILHYQISGTLTNAAFDVVSGNEIVLLPQSPIAILAASTAQTFTTLSAQFYTLTNAAINASNTTALNINSSDGTAGNYLSVAINQGSSVATSGAFSAINLTSTFDNIELINWGSISSPGGTGVSASSTSGGSVDIIDNGSVSAAQSAINVHTNGTGTLNVSVGSGTTVSSTTGFGIFAVATGSGPIDVSTIQGATVTAGTSGIFAENQGTAVGSAIAPSTILVSTSGTINSGSNPGSGEPAGILAGFLGGTTAPANPPNAAVFGNVTVINNANITASTGVGIEGINEGIGDITINDDSSTTISATAAGATVAGFTQYGIAAFNYGSGKITVTTDYGATINSGGSGIDAVNQATSIAAAANSTLTVIASGAITSGANLNNSGSAPAGITAGYNPGNAGVLNANVAGNVLVEYDGTVQNGVGGLIAGAGDGINAFNYGIGNIEVDLGYGAAITALNPASAGSTAPYGISASNRGTGDVIVNMSGGDSVHSGSIGINANNQDTSISAAANSMIVVMAAGTITSGTINSNNGNQPSGISAGYLGAGTGANTSINGTVIVDNNATINASAGSAINAYNYGNGDVTVNDSGGTTITGAQYGISAYTEGGGTGNLSINVGSSATITATNPAAASTSTLDYGIQAFSNESGDISVITSSGDTITANGTGINAVNEATVIAQSVNSSIVVTANGIINSGTEETGTGTPPGGIVAGYLGGNSILTTYPLTGLFGEVDVNNYATINAAAGDGIRAYNYGIGDIEVNDFAGSITLQGQVATGNSGLQNGYGQGITASNEGSGNIDVMTAAGTSIDASLAGSGIAAINKAPAPIGSTFVVPDTSHVSVLAYGSIKSGTDLTGSGDVAAGILAGYNPANADTADNNVHGIVHIDDYASITAAAGTDGIRGVNYGDGTITIIAESGAIISAGEYGIAAIGGDGGDISINTSAILTGGAAAIHTTTSSAAETVTIENLGHMTGLVLTENAAFDNGAGGEWDLAGASTFASGTNTLNNEGVIDSTGTASITATTGTLSVTNTGTVNVQSGTLDIGGSVTGTGQFTIGSGDQLEFAGSVASGQTITFEGSTGTLKLDDPVDFHGQISGLTGSDGINLAGFDSTTVVSANIEATETILTVTDDNHTGPQHDAVITLLGNYNGSSFNFSNVQGGVLIVDPPATAPAMTTVTATAANQTLTGTGTADNFAFNFANVGQATVTNFHADTDVVEVKASLFANLQAILDATHDDANGNAVVALDSHDSITLTGVAKAQLHPTDFHLV